MDEPILGQAYVAAALYIPDLCLFQNTCIRECS